MFVAGTIGPFSAQLGTRPALAGKGRQSRENSPPDTQSRRKVPIRCLGHWYSASLRRQTGTLAAPSYHNPPKAGPGRPRTGLPSGPSRWSTPARTWSGNVEFPALFARYLNLGGKTLPRRFLTLYRVSLPRTCCNSPRSISLRGLLTCRLSFGHYWSSPF